MYRFEISLIDFVILVLATYRISIMFANGWEYGPWGVLKKIRERIGVVYTESGDAVAIPGSFADGMLCKYCNSVWVGALVAMSYAVLYIAGLPAYLLFLPWALSGASVIIVQLLE